MIPQAQIQQVMLSRLEKYVECVCVPSNTTEQMPAYPYISFTVINTETQKGTYAAATEVRDGKEVKVLYKQMLQKWSLTVQSNNEEEAMHKALLISDFFAEAGRLDLEDNGIIVADIGAIVPRDNFLTIEYEYRKGLDVTIRLNNIIEDTTNEIIETVTINDSIKLEK